MRVVVEPQHHDSPDDGDEQAVEIEAGHAGLTELVEQEAADHGAQRRRAGCRRSAPDPCC